MRRFICIASLLALAALLTSSLLMPINHSALAGQGKSGEVITKPMPTPTPKKTPPKKRTSVGNSRTNRPAKVTYGTAEIIFARQTTSDPGAPANLSTTYVNLILKIEGVEAAVPVIRFAIQGSGSVVEQVEGLDWKRYSATNNLNVISGRAVLSGDEVMIDEIKAHDGKLALGDKLTLFERPFTVTGIYAPEFGARMKIPFSTLDEQIGAEGKCTYILVKCRNAGEEVTVAHRLNEQFPGNVIQFARDTIK